MKKHYLLGIDNGGTISKCVVFDTTGGEIAVASRRVPIIQPQPGMVERDGNLVWHINAELIQEAIQSSHIDAADILAVGLTGYGNGLCLVDGAGNPVTNCIVSTDNRGTKYVEQYTENGIEKELFRYTHQTLWSAQPAILLPWYRDHMPEVLESAACAFGIKDFIRMKLTGVPCCEPTEASSWCLMDLKSMEFKPEIFELLGIAGCYRLMPPCVGVADIAGYVSEEAATQCGLQSGIPVVGGCFDVDAAVMGSGILDNQTLCLVAGTWSINEYLSDRLEFGYRESTNSISAAFLPGHYLVEESTPTSASNFDWFIDRFLDGGTLDDAGRKELIRQCDQKIESMSPDHSNIIFIPYLFASATHPDAAGAFFNLNASHDRDDLLQAVYEGVVYSTLFHIRRLMNHGHTFRQARLSGGVANSSVWSQMMSDALEMPVATLQGSELSALGAAICAAIAVGVYEDFNSAIEQMVEIKQVFQPRREFSAVYRRKFSAYQKALAALDYFHTQHKPEQELLNE